MAATVQLSVFTSTDAGTETTNQSGIDFISADNATNSAGNRTTFPITAGNNSYEKWLKLRIVDPPDNQIDNILWWTDGSVDQYTEVFVGVTGSGITPVATASLVAAVTGTLYTSGGKLTWDAGPYTSTGLITNYLVLQLRTQASASPGDWTQETFTYSWDET